MVAITLVLASIKTAWAQTTAPEDGVSDEARFPISRGANFTFQPSSGSLCHWAVAQYPGSGKEFFALDSQQTCPQLASNASTTLRLQFGDEVEPGNGTLTVQCKEPSVWKFIINDDEPEREGKTVLDSVCDNGDLPFEKDSLGGGGLLNGSSAGNQTSNAGVGSPPWETFVPGHRGNWSHDPPASTSLESTTFLHDSPHSSIPASNFKNTMGNGGSVRTGVPPASAGSGLAASPDQGQMSSQLGNAPMSSADIADHPISASESDLSSARMPRQSFGAVPLTNDLPPTAQTIADGSDQAAMGDTGPSVTEQISGSTWASTTSIPTEIVNTSAADPLSPCVCTC